MSPEAAQSLLALSTHLFEQARHPDCDTAARYINNRSAVIGEINMPGFKGLAAILKK
jgi:hypothetical protein